MKECIYCSKDNLPDVNYCGYCGMPFSEGEILVEPGDVFQPEGPQSASLSFDTSLPDGIFLGDQFFVFPKTHKKRMRPKLQKSQRMKSK